MEAIQTHWAEVDENGRLILPAEFSQTFGLEPGVRLRLDKENNTFRLHRPVTHLAKIYIEPTTLCNLDCRTCIRNNWDEPLGKMSEATFENLEKSIRNLSTPPSIFFGGLGEPLYHPRIIDWVRRAKSLGSTVELITNGTLLKPKALASPDRRRAWMCCGFRLTAPPRRATAISAWAPSCRTSSRTWVA